MRFGLFVLSVFIILALLKCADNPRPPPDKATPITLYGVYSAMAYEPDATERRYEGKWLRIEGIVTRIDRNRNGVPYCTILEPTQQLTVDCLFYEAKPLTLITPGDRVRIIGQARFRSGRFVLVDCTTY